MAQGIINSATWFTREGVKFVLSDFDGHNGQLRETSSAHALYTYLPKCGRCEGNGDSWAEIGYTCPKCSGAGVLGQKIVKLFTLEQLNQLNTRDRASISRAYGMSAQDAVRQRAQRVIEANTRLYPRTMLKLILYAGDSAILNDIKCQALSISQLTQAQVNTAEEVLKHIQTQQADATP